MELNPLTAISPVDGRYREKVKLLAPYFSEFGLIKYRIWVEVEYFIALCELGLPQLKNADTKKVESLRELYLNFTLSDAEKIKSIEKTTNHDVKAVEYFIKEYLRKVGLSEFQEFIHIGLTSQDINNTATPALIRDFMEKEYMSLLEKLKTAIDTLANEWEKIPMLARTHGQPASPTRLGKEMKVFVERIEMQINQLQNIPWSAKFGGATGNFNAHFAAFPGIDWVEFADKFVNKKLLLQRSRITTQIEHYDNLAALFQNLSRINTILIDFSRDIWSYISMEYFRQKIKAGETGSSTMPHKVNPIDFENAEGNLGVANALFGFLSEKLPVSRLQRDLTDSTVLRNAGVPMAHTVLSFKSLLNGLNKLILNKDKMENDLENNWAVIAEAIQTILRREKYPEPYEALKELTRINKSITKEVIHDFIDSLHLSQKIKMELKSISPKNYTGV